MTLPSPPDTEYSIGGQAARAVYPKLIYCNKLGKGGRFAAWEQPELFAAEVRAAFRSLRP